MKTRHVLFAAIVSAAFAAPAFAQEATIEQEARAAQAAAPTQVRIERVRLINWNRTTVSGRLRKIDWHIKSL